MSTFGLWIRSLQQDPHLILYLRGRQAGIQVGISQVSILQIVPQGPIIVIDQYGSASRQALQQVGCRASRIVPHVIPIGQQRSRSETGTAQPE